MASSKHPPACRRFLRLQVTLIRDAAGCVCVCRLRAQTGSVCATDAPAHMAGNRSKNNPRDGLEGQWIWPGNLDSCDEHEQAC